MISVRRALLLPALLAACGGSTPVPEVRPAPGAAVRASAFRDGEILAYTIKSSAGLPLGRAHSLYVGSGELPQVRTRIAESGQSSEVVTSLRPDGSPATFKALSSLAGRYELRFKDRAVSVITEDGAREQPYARDGSVLLPAHDLMLLSLALSRAELKPGSVLKLSALSPRAVKAQELSVPIYADAEGRVVAQLHWSAPDGSALAGGKATFDGQGRVLRFETESGTVLEREVPPGEPPRVELREESVRYVRPSDARWNDREVAIDVDGGQLVGTLSEPRVRATANRPAAPAVLFLPDLGARDRHGIAGAFDYATWQILDRLAEEGFVVLRLDARGAGKSTAAIGAPDIGLLRMKVDAKLCLRFLRAQPSADPDRLFVVGHGAGGVAALALAAEEELAGVAVLGTPLRKLSEVLAQAEIAGAGAELDPGARERILREMRLLPLAFAGQEAAQAQISPDRLARYQPLRSWINEVDALDWSKLLPQIQEEVGVFQGMKDFEVSWREDAKPLVEQLKKAGNKKSKLLVYENVDHWMKSEPLESSYRRYADRTRRVEGRFLDELVSWLMERAK